MATDSQNICISAEANRRAQLELTCKALLAYCLFIILWGAFVRFSGSGDGCGEFWPLCYGVLLPDAPSSKTLIELLHRATSGVFGLGILVMTVITYRLYPRSHPMRWAAGLTLFFTITEALIGAKLVLFGLVADNETLARAVVIGLHLLNTFALLASLVACIFFAKLEEPSKLSFSAEQKRLLYPLLSIFLLIVIAGSVTSLSNTLYPSASLAEGIEADLNTESPLLLRLRILHPIFSLTLFWVLLRLLSRIAEKFTETARTVSRAQQLLWGQVALGVLTLTTLSPVYLKLSHLLISDFIWISFVWIALTTASPRSNQAL